MDQHDQDALARTANAMDRFARVCPAHLRAKNPRAVIEAVRNVAACSHAARADADAERRVMVQRAAIARGVDHFSKVMA